MIPIVWGIGAWLVFRKNKTAGFIMACLCITFLTYMHVCTAIERSFTPPPAIHSLGEFIRSKGLNYQVSVLIISSQEFYELTPQWTLLQRAGAFAFLRSGPPSYIFNKAGCLSDWTSDRDEDPGFRNKWIAPAKRKDFSLDQAQIQIGKEQQLVSP